MAPTKASLALASFLIAVCIPGLQSICVTSQAIKEGSTLEYTCTANYGIPPIYDLAVWVVYSDGTGKVNAAQCNQDGSCSSVWPETKYNKTMDPITHTMTVYIQDADHTISSIYCEQDAAVRISAEDCTPSFYKDQELVGCEGPIYPDGINRADFSCYFDVWPQASCSFDYYGNSTASLGAVQTNETSRDDGSILLWICSVHVYLNDSLPGSYGFIIGLRAAIYSFAVTESLDPYELTLLSLLDTKDDKRVYAYPTEPALDIKYNIVGTPGPGYSILTVRYDPGDSFEEFKGNYSVEYQYNSTGQDYSTLFLTLRDGFSTDSMSYFQLEVSNGLRGDSLYITFSVAQGQVATEPPTPNTYPVTSMPPATSEPPPPSSTSPPEPDDDHEDDDQDDDHKCSHQHGMGGYWHHHGDDNQGSGSDPAMHYHGYLPGMGYGPYQGYGPYPAGPYPAGPYPVAYGPWGYPNPRFGGMMVGQYPPFMNMGWYPYRGWFPWGG